MNQCTAQSRYVLSNISSSISFSKMGITLNIHTYLFKNEHWYEVLIYLFMYRILNVVILLEIYKFILKNIYIMYHICQYISYYNKI